MEPLEVNFPQRPVNDLFSPPNLLSEDAKKQGMRQNLVLSDNLSKKNEVGAPDKFGNNSKKSKG